MSNLEAAKRWQAAQIARGECRACGNKLAPRSVSRCYACLERARQDMRRRRGILTVETRKRGRPMLGTVSERVRAVRETDEFWLRPRKVVPPPGPLRRLVFKRLGGGYQTAWEEGW